MAFKDYLKTDLAETFFNLDEFGAPGVVNGIDMIVMVDNDHLKKRIKTEYAGIVAGELLYFTATESFGREPKIGDIQDFRGEDIATGEIFEGLYQVVDVRRDAGLYEIVLRSSDN